MSQSNDVMISDLPLRDLLQGTQACPIRSAVKRGLDVIVSCGALVVLSPILLIVTLIIRLNSPGPALFRQLRLGRGGESFTLYKFRSMFVGAPDIRNPDGSTFNAQDDPRVTSIGCLLRQTSLDELPQLFNVLRGSMSLVGPRPDQIDQLQYYTFKERQKLLVKPGISGLAQINGRNNIPWEQRKQLDLTYVKDQSLRLDLSILFRTIPYMFCRRDVFIKQTPEMNQ